METQSRHGRTAKEKVNLSPARRRYQDQEKNTEPPRRWAPY